MPFLHERADESGETVGKQRGSGRAAVQHDLVGCDGHGERERRQEWQHEPVNRERGVGAWEECANREVARAPNDSPWRARALREEECDVYRTLCTELTSARAASRANRRVSAMR